MWTPAFLEAISSPVLCVIAACISIEEHALWDVHVLHFKLLYQHSNFWMGQTIHSNFLLVSQIHQVCIWLRFIKVGTQPSNFLSFKELLFFFIWEAELQGERERYGKIFHPLTHFLNDHTVQSWTEPKPGNSCRSSMWVNGSKDLTIPIALPGHYQEFGLEVDIQDMN